MSWKEMSTSQTVCPCGKGYITQKHYGDDWNRFKDGKLYLYDIVTIKKETSRPLES